MELDAALALAITHLGKIAQSSQVLDLVIVDEHTLEHSAGFVFFYDSRTHRESGDFRDALAGNGPILVLHSGEIVTLPTHQSVEVSLAGYEQG